MKKTISLIFTFLAVNISAIAQCNQRPNADHYLLQGNTYLHVEEIDLDPLDSNGEIRNITSVRAVVALPRQGRIDNCIVDFAQLQHSDSLMTIVGVSALLIRHNYGTMNAYLCIADTDFNVYRRAKIPNISIDCNYTELFFEQPINVNGNFSIIWDNPKPNVQPDIYNFDTTHVFAGNNNPSLLVAQITKDTTNCGLFAKPTFLCTDSIVPWTLLDEELLPFLSFRYAAYLFPIFGELDTTLSLVGQPEDTITQPEDTSSLARINMVDKYSHIFPNPAKEELNIQCSFKINDIEIYNSLGQKVFSKNIEGYNTTVNVANLKKGTFFIKISTTNGVANKKFIIQ